MAVVSIRFPSRHTSPPRTRLGPRGTAHPHAHRIRLLLLTCFALAVTLTLAHLFLRAPLTTAVTDALPATWIKAAAVDAQSALDLAQLRPSQAPAARLEALTTRFAAMAAPDSGALPYRLAFRQGGTSGPLSYALPDGSIVVSDELLAALPDDTHVLAVLCHELGHLQGRHLLRASVEDQVFSLALASVLGLDHTVIHALTRGILNAETRDAHHIEADRFAQRMLAQNGLPPGTLQTALQALARQTSTTPAPSPLLRSPSAALIQSRLRSLPPAKG